MSKLKIRFEENRYTAEFRLIDGFDKVSEKYILILFREAKHQHQLNKAKKCSVCKREFIVDLESKGTSHQSIVAICCKECAIKVSGNIMEQGKEEEIEFETPK